MKIIAGMHRSGTSLVAHLFLRAGADFGDTTTFYEPDRWNPDGYFEQRDVHAINMPLINGRLGRLAYLSLPSESAIRRRGRRRAGAIGAAASKYRNAVLKENRFCLTLPAWLDHGAQVEKLLLVLREPWEVAASLRRRNRLPARWSHSIWVEHNRRLLDAAHRWSIPIRVVRYRDLLDANRQCGEAASAFSFFGLELDQDAVGAVLEHVVDRSQNHNRQDEPPSRLPWMSTLLWHELVACHERQRCSPSSLA